MPQDVNPLLDRLIEAFPACFSRSVPQPLKIGLGEELLALAGVHPGLADLSHTQIRRALKGYTGALAYRKALARGGPRYGLDGQPAGEVTPKQQRDASRPRKTPPAPAPPAAPAVDLKARLQEVIALAVAGQMDEAIDGGFRPVKPAAATPAPKAPAPKAPAPPGSPAMGDATPSLKRRTLSRGIARPLTRWKRQGCAPAPDSSAPASPGRFLMQQPAVLE